jgi:hypothetical protein
MDFFISLNRAGRIKRNNEETNNIPDIGREKNIIKLPLDKISDCPKASSRIGPKIKAKIRGAGS